MITKEIREWMDKVKRGAYSEKDALYEFSRFYAYLTKDEILFIKNRLKDYFQR